MVDGTEMSRLLRREDATAEPGGKHRQGHGGACRWKAGLFGVGDGKSSRLGQSDRDPGRLPSPQASSDDAAVLGLQPLHPGGAEGYQGQGIEQQVGRSYITELKSPCGGAAFPALSICRTARPTRCRRGRKAFSVGIDVSLWSIKRPRCLTWVLYGRLVPLRCRVMTLDLAPMGWNKRASVLFAETVRPTEAGKEKERAFCRDFLAVMSLLAGPQTHRATSSA